MDTDHYALPIPVPRMAYVAFTRADLMDMAAAYPGDPVLDHSIPRRARDHFPQPPPETEPQPPNRYNNLEEWTNELTHVLPDYIDNIVGRDLHTFGRDIRIRLLKAIDVTTHPDRIENALRQLQTQRHSTNHPDQITDARIAAIVNAFRPLSNLYAQHTGETTPTEP